MPSINLGLGAEVLEVAQAAGAAMWEQMQAEARKSQFPN